MAEYENQTEQPRTCNNCGESENTILVAEGDPDELTPATADYLGCFNCNTMTEVR